MANVYATQTGESYGTGIFKRVSWGALFAGIILTTIIQFWLTLLGIGIGLAVINPATDQNPFGGIGIGGAIWYGLSSLISLFAGGWITARLAGSQRGLNGILHSIVLWASVAMLSIFLMTTAIGTLVSGVAGLVGKGISAAGGAISAAAPDIQKELQQRGYSIDSIINEVQKMAQKGATKGGDIEELRQTLQKIITSGEKNVSREDRNTLVNELVARSNMSRAQAEKTVDNWIQKYQQAVQSAEQTKQQALKMAEKTMGALSTAAIWLWILMLLGAGAAGAGGWLGAKIDTEK